MRPISCASKGPAAAPAALAFLAAAAALVTAPAFAADVYRSIAPDGTVIYSDRPTGERAERVSIAVRSPSAGSAPARPSPARSARASGGGAEEAAETQPAEPTPEEVAEDRARQRAENCAIARERVERYSTAHRLYRTTADGEREYLDDAQIDEARARAAADVDAWCD